MAQGESKSATATNEAGVARVSGERRVVRKGAVSIEIFVRGEGPTVLMHPGFGRTACDYNDMSTRLAKAGFKPIAINPRGINASEGPLEGLTLHDYADDVWMVVDCGHAMVSEQPRAIAEAVVSFLREQSEHKVPRSTS
jgi:hypothetical protein